MKFNIEDHVAGLMMGKGSEAPDDFKFSLRGDLNQMGTQKALLQLWSFDVRLSDVNPVLREKDVVEALSLIWKTRTEGWWHYKEELIKYGICTELGIIKELESKESATPNKKETKEKESEAPSIDRKINWG